MSEEAILERMRELGAQPIERLAAELQMAEVSLAVALDDLGARGEVKCSPKGMWFVPGHARAGSGKVLTAGFADELEQIRSLARYLRLCALEEEGASVCLDSAMLSDKWIAWPEDTEWSHTGGDRVHLTTSVGRQFIETVVVPGTRLMYGYPLWIRHRDCSFNGDAWSAVPILVQPADIAESTTKSMTLVLGDEFPRVNPRFLDEAFEFPEERRDFVEALGLLGEDVEAGVSIDACVQRLIQLGPLPWPLQYADELNVQALSGLAGYPVPVEGVHNAAALGCCEELRYRKSLASELTCIAEQGRTADLGLTSLATLVGRGLPAKTADVHAGSDLPLDECQLAVVRAGFSRPLTVVTGPPGTGKSQVVASVLVNAYLSGRSALFASYNHKAVSVVEDKVNRLAGQRFVLRAGTSRDDRQHFQEIAEAIDDFVGAALPDDEPKAGGLAEQLRAKRVELRKEASRRDIGALEQTGDAARARLQGESNAFADWFAQFPLVLSSLPLWCVTNLSVKWSFPLRPALFDILVIDEASQCDIASALPLMFRARQVVIIGDPMQLRHITSISEERSRQNAVGVHLPAELRSKCDYASMSLFDAAAAVVGSEQVLPLTSHYRSHPEIIGFPNAQWYNGDIKVFTNLEQLADTGALGQGMYWLPVRSTVSPGSTGVIVEDEARIIADRLTALLLKEGFSGSVGVVTPFRAQRDLIDAMLQESIPLEVLREHQVVVKTAHGFQGDERDVMFLSPCLRPNITQGSFRFLRETENLLNVAVTRARATLVIVGDLEACRGCRIPHFEALARYWDELRLLKSVSDDRVRDDKALFQELVALRLELARTAGAPAYTVFPDETLRAMAALRPRNLEELAAVKGVGPAKLGKYGALFLELIGNHRGQSN